MAMCDVSNMVAMRIDDFFEDKPDWTGDLTGRGAFKEDFVRSFLSGPGDGISDVEVAIPLANLVHENLISCGTDGIVSVQQDEIKVAIRVLKAVLNRLRVIVDIPFHDYSSFKAYWLRNGCSGSWAARRAILSQIFDPIHEFLAQLDVETPAGPTSSIRNEATTGWPTVDEELRELRRAFASATTPQNYAAIGLQCVRVIGALADSVYDPSVHVRIGEEALSYDKTDLRIARFIEDALPGRVNENLRGLAKKATAFAHEVKHSTNPDVNETAIVADSVILLCGILRSVQCLA
ncbi:hypothetical protein AXFE_11440 [Acidithrix ferrooxidans]|uniref:Abortive infection protein-like C-terminal domain-containing protein n=2 Tax=Acidithrix ferrooxidans TaxID=1280514 RepID=A0A0D8HJA4_9ACTN|nr:hypothetical protein AXFE_11440 [Acidithrix ferrooxidans]